MKPVARWNDVPANASGVPLLVADSAGTYRRYLRWLARYLFRPRAREPNPLPVARAWALIALIESEIAAWIWEHPHQDYPPSGRVRHADFLHRQELSAVLSRVPSLEDRVQLLDRFYRSLARDGAK